MSDTSQYNPETGRWEPVIPLPYYYGLLPWAWKRLTGWRDEYGRKAERLELRDYFDWWKT